MKYVIFFFCILVFPKLSYSQCEYAFGKWDTSLSPMLGARSSFSAVNYNDSIYIIGGYTNNLDAIEYASSVDVYVPATDTWIEGVTEMPFPRGCPKACLIGDKIYAIGGAHIIESSFTTYDSLHIYNVKTNSWETGQSLPVPLGYYTADTIDGRIYVAGGGGTGYSIYNSLYVYDPELDEWTQMASMSTSRWGASAQSWKGKLYVFGGYSSSDWTVSNSFEVYDPDTDKWTLLSKTNTPRTVMTMTLLNNKFYLLGGYRGYSNTEYYYTNFISRYDPSTDSWFDFFQTDDEMPAGRRFSTSVTVNDILYLFGGGYSDLMDNVWSYSLETIQQNQLIKDTSLISESIEINLLEYFSSSRGAELSYSVCPGYDESLIEVTIDNSTLKINKLSQNTESTEIALNVHDSILTTISTNTFKVNLLGSPSVIQAPFSENNHLSVFPNPVSGIAVIDYKMAESGKAVLKIYSSVGQEIELYNLENNRLIAGSFELNMEHYSNGFYFAVLETDNSTSVCKILVRH